VGNVSLRLEIRKTNLCGLARWHNSSEERVMTIVLKTAHDVKMDAWRAYVREHLDLCTEKQVALYHEIYPQGIDKLDEVRLINSIRLINDTIRDNAKRAVVVTEAP
jgi:hypothetical protein